MSCILVLHVVVQILFHSSFSALVVEASRCWCGIGMLASFVRSLVVASLAKESAFSFPPIPWCDGIQVEANFITALLFSHFLLLGILLRLSKSSIFIQTKYRVYSVQTKVSNQRTAKEQ